jgi:fatty-acid peroxygenase
MTSLAARLSDGLLGLIRRGNLWLPERRGATGCPAHGRLGPLRYTALAGPDELPAFYDEANVRRHGALPEPVLSTLFGHGAVHTLDGAAHRHRKALFTGLLMTPEAVAGVSEHVARAWDDAVTDWAGRDRVVLFDEAAVALTRGVTAWAGLDVPQDDVAAFARDLVALVDGVATAKPRHWRARVARGRREAWLGAIVTDVRGGRVRPRPGSALDVVARHRDLDGELLTPRVAAVELLNIIRPTVAVCWFVQFAAHALHHHPEQRQKLQDPRYATAFAHELRRFYPFAPFVGGLAVREFSSGGVRIPAGSMVLPDLYGTDHDPALWPDPYAFRPERFLDREIGAFELVPQGGGDPRTGHRCPGERVTIGLLETLCPRLAALGYSVPPQDLGIPVDRIPARVRSGMVLSSIRLPTLVR